MPGVIEMITPDDTLSNETKITGDRAFFDDKIPFFEFNGRKDFR